MIIDIKDGRLRITEIDDNFSPIHTSQLRYFGFMKISPSEYLAITESSDQIIRKVLDYFSEAQVFFELSDECLKKTDLFISRKERFNKKIAKAQNFKNGIFDKEDFRLFNIFLDKHIKRKLLDHQRKAAYHLLLIQNGANFSVPGSGKTSVVLAVYEKLRLDGLVNTIFVVGPTACFGPWKNEFIETLGRIPNYRILAGGDSFARKLEYYNWGDNKGELYLTSFQTLLNDYKDAQKFLSNTNIKAFIIVDEAHYIKQIGGEWAKAVLSLASHGVFRCVLTGTPLPKAFSDAFNLFDFLYPETPPLDELTKSRIELLEKHKNDIKIKPIYEEKIDPLIYRVRKNDLGLIPAIFHPAVLIEMNTHEKILYHAILRKIRDFSIDDYLHNIDLIQRLMRGRIIRLRQCVSYAKLLMTALDSYEEDLLADDKYLASTIINYDHLEKPGKLIELSKMVESFQERKLKVVIWSNFIETIKLIKKELNSFGYKSEIIFGATPTETTLLSEEKTREQIRDEFVDKNSGLDILIANPAACAESISLHKTCFNAIYYDLSYNCAQYLQSLDRIHRVGGSELNQANYFFLRYQNSIDQDIMENLNNKAQRMYGLIDKDFNIYSLDMFSDIYDDDVDAYKRLIRDENVK